MWLNSPIFWQQSSWFWIQAQYFFSPLSSNDDSQVSTFADRYPCCTTLIKSGVSETLVFWIFTDFPGSLQYLILYSFSWGFHCLHPWYRFSVQYQLKKFSKTLPQLLPTPRLVASIVVCCHVHTPILRLLLVLRIRVILKLSPFFKRPSLGTLMIRILWTLPKSLHRLSQYHYTILTFTILVFLLPYCIL